MAEQNGLTVAEKLMATAAAAAAIRVAARQTALEVAQTTPIPPGTPAPTPAPPGGPQPS